MTAPMQTISDVLPSATSSAASARPGSARPTTRTPLWPLLVAVVAILVALHAAGIDFSLPR